MDAAAIQRLSGSSNAAAAALAAAAFAASSASSAAMLGAASAQSGTPPKSLAEFLAGESASTFVTLGADASSPLLYNASGLLGSTSWIDSIIGSTAASTFPPSLPASAADRLQSNLAVVLGLGPNAGANGASVAPTALASPSPATAAAVAGVLASSAPTLPAAGQQQALNDLLGAVISASASTGVSVSATPNSGLLAGALDTTTGSVPTSASASLQALALSEKIRASELADAAGAAANVAPASTTASTPSAAATASTPALPASVRLATSSPATAVAPTAAPATAAAPVTVDAIESRLQNLLVSSPLRAVPSVATDPIRASAIAAFQVGAAIQRLSSDDSGRIDLPDDVRSTPLAPLERVQPPRAL